MNTLLKTTWNPMIIVFAVITVSLLGKPWYMQVYAQIGRLTQNEIQIAALQRKIQAARALAHRAPQVEADGKAAREQLAAIENSVLLPAGDPYRYMVNLLTKAVKTNKMDFGILSREQISGTPLFPDFPYKSATFSWSLSGAYADFRELLANLENQHPFMQFQIADSRSLEVSQANGPEQRNFEVRISALLQPAASR